MLDNIPIKTRIIGILVLQGIVFLFLVAYARQSFGVVKQLKTWNQKVIEARGASSTLIATRSTLTTLDSQIAGLKNDQLELDDPVLYLEYIELLSQEYQLNLISMPKESIEVQNQYRVAEVQLTVSGSYGNILQFLFAIEQRDQLGTVDYLSFKKENLRTSAGKTPILKAAIQVNRLLHTQPMHHESIQTASN